MTAASILALLATGAIAGIIAGFMGIGGGAILTPLCLMIFPAMGVGDESLIRVIFGTNMFLVTVFSLSAVSRHLGAATIDRRTILIMGIPAIFGAVTGSWTSSIVQAASLKSAYAVLLLISSILIVTRGGTKPTSGKDHAFIPHRFKPLLGFVAGYLGSLLGLGGGVLMIPGLILLFAYPLDRVAATSSSVIIFIGLAGMGAYMWYGAGAVSLPGWSTGWVWWSAAIPMALGGVPMARVGAWLNTKTHDRILKRVFGAVLFIIAIKLLIS
jgi:uncharacterized protein